MRKSQDGRGHAGGSTFGRESLDYSTRTPDRSSTLRTLKRRDKTYPDRSNVLRIARLVLEQVDALVETGRHSGRGEAGRLSIGFCTSMSAGNLRATLLDFKNRSPYVDLATVERSRIRLMTALRNGTVDIVISPGGRLSPDNKALRCGVNEFKFHCHRIMPWRRVRSSVGQICVTKLFSSASTRPWTRQSKQSLNCPQRGTPLPEDDPNQFTPAQGIPSLAALTTRTYQPVEMQAKEPGKDMPGSSCEGSSSEHLLVRPGRRPKRKTRDGES